MHHKLKNLRDYKKVQHKMQNPAAEAAKAEALAVHNSPDNNPDYKNMKFQKGDRFLVLDQTTKTWWKALNLRTQETGYIPTAYVARIFALGNERWFHPNMDRAESSQALLSNIRLGKGSFIVRPSSVPGSFALDIKINATTVRNYQILQIERGEHGVYIEATRSPFKTVPQLIEFYRNNRTPELMNIKLTQFVERQVQAVAKRNDIWWEIDKQEITLKKELGSGNFGKVYLGFWTALPVAIKILKPTSMADESMKFLKNEFDMETSALKRLQHTNIVKLYGISSTAYPYYIVTEYMRGGSLLNFIKNRAATQLLQQSQNLNILSQIASGMAYLADLKIIHRDLAARNVLIDVVSKEGRIIAKICDFGLHHWLTEQEYYKAVHHGFPLGWSALEVLTSQRLSLQSDVWSFGVVIFELYTNGEHPYARELGSPTHKKGHEYTYDALQSFLTKGNRLRKPSRCPVIVHKKISVPCMNSNYNMRPTFNEIKSILSSILPEELEITS